MFHRKVKPVVVTMIIIVLIISVVLYAYYFDDVELAALIAAITIGVVGFFQESIRNFYFQPQLDIYLNITPPDCHKTKIRYDFSSGVIRIVDAYYYRFVVKNLGNLRAKKVEVVLKEKHVKRGSGEFAQDMNFLPLNLKWSHDGVVVRESIGPSMSKYCDFGPIVSPEDTDNRLGFLVSLKSGSVVLDMDVEVKPYTGTNFLFPGVYRFVVVVTADNAPPITKIFEVQFNNFWSENESEMLLNGLTVKVV